MMAPVLLVVLAAVSVFAAPEDKDLLQDGDGDYSDRIIGGFASGIEEFPFMAGLIFKQLPKGYQIRNNLCGGTILTEYWVLTSATCANSNLKLANGTELQLTHVRAGSTSNDQGGLKRRVVETVSHKSPRHNIGLVKIERGWPLNEITIDVGRLPRQDDPIPVGSTATILGWGSVDQEATPAGVLMKEYALVISVEYCNSRLSSGPESGYRVTDSQICTEFNAPDKPSSVYRNDYGSPVLVGGEVVGIVSWFSDEMPTLVPNVHTRVSSYIDWIQEVMDPSRSANSLPYISVMLPE